jgi:hypothetical protein
METECTHQTVNSRLTFNSLSVPLRRYVMSAFSLAPFAETPSGVTSATSLGETVDVGLTCSILTCSLSFENGLQAFISELAGRSKRVILSWQNFVLQHLVAQWELQTLPCLLSYQSLRRDWTLSG